jgi:hypothetical protein
VSRTVGGGWGWPGLYRSVELQVGERVLYEADAGWNAGWLGSTWGKLYVTNQRLIWARNRFMPPTPRKPVLAVPVASILGTEVKHPSFGSRWRLLARTLQRTYSFVLAPVSLKEDIEELRDMIEKLRGQRETDIAP